MYTHLFVHNVPQAQCLTFFRLFVLTAWLATPAMILESLLNPVRMALSLCLGETPSVKSVQQATPAPIQTHCPNTVPLARTLPKDMLNVKPVHLVHLVCRMEVSHSPVSLVNLVMMEVGLYICTICSSCVYIIE